MPGTFTNSQTDLRVRIDLACSPGSSRFLEDIDSGLVESIRSWRPDHRFEFRAISTMRIHPPLASPVAPGSSGIGRHSRWRQLCDLLTGTQTPTRMGGKPGAIRPNFFSTFVSE